MHLVVQIPSFNEAATIAAAIADIPRQIPAVSQISILVIDDGSSDNTAGIAKSSGADCLITHSKNLGLAAAFRSGLDAALQLGGEIIVNFDADLQYCGRDIERLIQPILKKEADIVIGDRETGKIPSFSKAKKILQQVGSFVVRKLSKTEVQDVTSGFRAFSKEAAIRITIFSGYTYTHETIIQAKSKGLKIVDVKISTNPPTRRSRLMKNSASYVVNSCLSILRIFAMYNPLKIFLCSGTALFVSGSLIIGRFLYFYLQGEGQGKVQSLVIAAILCLSGFLCFIAGILADLLQYNRLMLEDLLQRVKKIELKTATTNDK